MQELIQKNSGGAVATILFSIIGSIGIIFAISSVLAFQTSGDNSPYQVFSQYFAGGQIGLTILSISGGIFAALLSRTPLPRWLSPLLYILFFIPVVVTCFIIGVNPGFVSGGIGENNINILWLCFWLFHLLWFVLLLFEPEVKSAQKAGREEQNRVNDILNEGK